MSRAKFAPDSTPLANLGFTTSRTAHALVNAAADRRYTRANVLIREAAAALYAAQTGQSLPPFKPAHANAGRPMPFAATPSGRGTISVPESWLAAIREHALGLGLSISRWVGEAMEIAVCGAVQAREKEVKACRADAGAARHARFMAESADESRWPAGCAPVQGPMTGRWFVGRVGNAEASAGSAAGRPEDGSTYPEVAAGHPRATRRAGSEAAS